VQAKPLEPIHRAFNNETARRLLTNLRAPLAIVGMAATSAFAKTDWFYTGLAISTVGTLLQLWCFSAIDKNRELAVNGPYKLVRNPMYLARFVLILGFVVVLGRLWLIPLYAIVYYFYAVNRVAREERKLIQVFGDAYADYASKVHRFLPTSSYPGGRLLYGRLDLLLRNNGHWNALGVAAFYTVCYSVAFGLLF
jgi:protein-S-isoprenylcysteine O-methyltransferase Ste14